MESIDYFHGEIGFDAAEALFVGMMTSGDRRTITLGGSSWNEIVGAKAPISQRLARLQDEMTLQMNGTHDHVDHQDPFFDDDRDANPTLHVQFRHVPHVAAATPALPQAVALTMTATHVPLLNVPLLNVWFRHVPHVAAATQRCHKLWL